MRGWHFAATVCGFISLLLLLTALATDHWLEANNHYAGLWKACFDYPTGFACGYIRMNVSGYFHATRAFLILGVFAGFISCALLSLLFFRSDIGSYSVASSASFSSFVTGAFALIAMAVFTEGERANNLHGWSFGLGWACVPLFLVTGGLAHKVHTYMQSGAGREMGLLCKDDVESA